MPVFKIFDTDMYSLKIQFDIFKNLSMSQKLLQTFELSDNLQKISTSGIQKHHPNYNQKQIIKLFLKRVLDKKLHHKIYQNSHGKQ